MAVKQGVYRRLIEHPDGSTTVEGTGTATLRPAKAWVVTIESEGLSADWLDDYVVVDHHEAGAIEVAERQHRSDFPMRTIKEGTEAYPLSLDNVRVLGRLVPEDER